MIVLWILVYLVFGYLAINLFLNLVNSVVAEERASSVESQAVDYETAASQVREVADGVGNEIGEGRAIAIAIGTILVWPVSVPILVARTFIYKREITYFVNHWK